MQRTYTVYPTRPGTIEVPALAITVPYARPEEGFRAPPVEVSAPPVAFEAVLPPGLSDVPHFFATTSFELRESWDREPEEVRVGEAAVRTITMRATSTPAMFPARPRVPGRRCNERLPRRTGGHRRRWATRIGPHRRARRTRDLQLRGEGSTELPPIEVSWWNLRTGELETARLPGREIRIASNPDLDAEQLELLGDEAVVDEPTNLVAWGFGGALAIGLGAWIASGVRRRLPGWREAARRAREEREQSEAAYWSRLQEAIRTGNPRDAMTALMRWLDHRDEAAGRIATLEGFVASHPSADLEREAAALSASLYAGRETETPRGLEGALRRARRAAPEGAQTPAENRVLPPSLNP